MEITQKHGCKRLLAFAMGILLVVLYSPRIPSSDSGYPKSILDSSFKNNIAQLNICRAKLSENMPRNKHGEMKAHHWDAQTPLWNGEERWEPMLLTAPCTIWYVGANVGGKDGVMLQKQYPCDIHVFEPVPSFFSKLKKNWVNVPHSTIHTFGLGSSMRTVAGVKIEGESTFGMESSGESYGETLQIRNVVDVLHEMNVTNIDLLHANCEGCEWELWDALLSSGMMRNISILQIGTHWFPEIKDIEQRYCDIESRMNETHTIVFKQPFGWERWLNHESLMAGFK